MNSSTPIFSVIIPAFNSEKYIKEALESVANQTYKDHEVIVIDDGSSDNTYELASSTLKSLQLNGTILRRSSYIKKGPGSCRNFGISKSQSSYLAFLDSDDIWLPDHLENAIHYFKEYGEEMVAYCAMGTLFDDMGEHGRMPENGFPCFGLQEALRFLLQKMFVTNQTLCVSRSAFFETTGYSDQLSCYEDWWLVLQLAKKRKFYFNPNSECLIRMRNDSLSRTSRKSGKGYRMSVNMFRDQLILWCLAKQSMLFSKAELSILNNSVVRFYRAQLGDMIRAKRFDEVQRIGTAMIAAGSKGIELWPKIWAGTFYDVSLKGFIKLIRLFKRQPCNIKNSR